MQNLGTFDASGIQPQQGMDKHPVGLYPFEISNTDIVSTQNNQGGMFVVDFKSPAGLVQNRYNLWNPSTQAVDIARKELSALCHAVGIFKLNFDNKGRELVGGRGSMEVGWQKGQEPGSEKGGVTGGYVEVKKVFDINGNEPGKAPSQPQTSQNFNQQPQQQPQQNQAPMQQQPGGGWGNQSQQPQQQQQPMQQQPMQQQQPQNNNWGNQQPQQNQTPNPPWGQR